MLTPRLRICPNESPPSKKPIGWSTVKTRLKDFDREGLLGLIHDLYGLSKDNRSFLHARFSMGADPLGVYKQRMYTALFPPLEKPVRVADARQAIAEYRKAIGRPEGLLELYVFWCETACRFSMDFGYADEPYFDSLLRQFEAALKLLPSMDSPPREAALARLVAVRDEIDVGYGVRDEMAWLLEQAGDAS